jgi:hypothetical protein
LRLAAISRRQLVKSLSAATNRDEFGDRFASKFFGFVRQPTRRERGLSVGPLPSAIQNHTQFAPGIVTGSSQTDAGRALVTFLSSPAAQTVLKAKGFE